ncbi:hypothetical protein ACQHIV_08195 [Kribbella sp. GL6]|uniref:hypothetical protein n=1 Tax=Kribbella sp. GL6 TaxID=3419765 RepID=UPI003D00CB95
MLAQSPVTGGSPATVAYAITWGTRYAATPTPASRSPRNQLWSYSLNCRTFPP